jgi:hypothetical protein
MRIKRTTAERKAIIEKQNALGLSVRSYCSENKIYTQLFYRKRKELITLKQTFYQLPVEITKREAVGKIRIGNITIEAGESVSVTLLTRMIRCALEVNDAYLSI